MDSTENKFETPRLTAQGRPVLPRSRSCEIFHDLTPTGEIGIRVNQDQWPSQENTNRYEKDGIHHADNRPLSGIYHHQGKVKDSFDHAARGSRYGFWSQKARDTAEGYSGSTRRVATSCESDARRGRWDSGDLPRTLDRGVPHNQGATYQALPLTSRGRFRVGVNWTDHEHRTDEMTSNINYAGISNEPNFERDYDINLQNTKYYKKKPALYDGEGNWEDYLVQFELIAAINKWSDIEKALELATSLRVALASRFQPENQAEMYRAQMKSKIRRRTEQIPVLGQDIKRLVRLAYPSAPIEIKEQLACECFIDSLNDADMEWAIFQAKAKSINNAIQVALEYEAFQNDRRKHGTKLCFDMKLNCLIDTGSTVSVLDSSMYNIMSKSVKPVLSNARSSLHMANGSVVMPMGTAVLPTQSDNKIAYHRLIVATIDIPMIIEFEF
ncbi:unnamed protein product [Mytilus coruscus]|uniref:Peptidase A2 domain-containing protein n=1 Tax=Mytilus coruscus TaxID=42192 RepID=A0A6J8BF14_MYTCO|nr:unnamed protein product [Mytilus coruscus]